MNDEKPDGSGTLLDSKVYMALEFVKPATGEAFVFIRQSLAVYHADGRISHEVLIKEGLFENLVNAFHGYVCKSAGIVTGLFEAPDAALQCASRLGLLYGQPVKVEGKQISMSLHEASR